MTLVINNKCGNKQLVVFRVLMSGDSGSVSELVAKWLSTTGIDPARLIDTTDVEFDQLQLSVDSLQQFTDTNEATAVQVSQRSKLVSIEIEAKINAEACILGKRKIFKKNSLSFVVI